MISATVSTINATSGEAVVDFWRAAGPALWFAKDHDFDRRFRQRFLDLHEAAARSELCDWLSTPTGALALVILLDQFPRNAFRGTPRMYETDQMARDVASDAIVAGYDNAIEPEMRLFLYLPFGHSESLPDQLLSVELGKRLGEPNLPMHSTIATSSKGLAAFRIAIRSWVAPCARKSSNISMKAAIGVSDCLTAATGYPKSRAPARARANFPRSARRISSPLRPRSGGLSAGRRAVPACSRRRGNRASSSRPCYRLLASCTSVSVFALRRLSSAKAHRRIRGRPSRHTGQRPGLH